MEASNARRELDEIARLRTATRHESWRGPRWAWVSIVGLCTAYVVGMIAIDRGPARLAMTLAWVGFVAFWTLRIHRDQRAIPDNQSHTVASRKSRARGRVGMVALWLAITIAGHVAPIAAAVMVALVGVSVAVMGFRAVRRP